MAGILSDGAIAVTLCDSSDDNAYGEKGNEEKIPSKQSMKKKR